MQLLQVWSVLTVKENVLDSHDTPVRQVLLLIPVPLFLSFFL